MIDMIKDAFKFAKTAPMKDVFMTLIVGLLFGIALIAVFELLLFAIAI